MLLKITKKLVLIYTLFLLCLPLNVSADWNDDFDELSIDSLYQTFYSPQEFGKFKLQNKFNF